MPLAILPMTLAVAGAISRIRSSTPMCRCRRSCRRQLIGDDAAARDCLEGDRPDKAVAERHHGDDFPWPRFVARAPLTAL
jgi:hypothetical protein